MIADIRRSLRAASYTLGGEDWSKLFNRYDSDHSGKLFFGEFRSAIRRHAKRACDSMSDSELRDFFQLVDTNADGGIDIREFGNFLRGSDAHRYTSIHSAEGREAPHAAQSNRTPQPNHIGPEPVDSGQRGTTGIARRTSSWAPPASTISISTAAWEWTDVLPTGVAETVVVTKNAQQLKQIFLYYIHIQKSGLSSRAEQHEQSGHMTPASFARFCRDTRIFPDLLYPQATVSNIFFGAAGMPTHPAGIAAGEALSFFQFCDRLVRVAVLAYAQVVQLSAAEKFDILVSDPQHVC
jgi:hypothetical protein